MASDLYGSSDSAIQLGNSRRQSVRDLNDRIQQHNSDVSLKITGLKSQAKGAEQTADMEAAGKALWTGAQMPSKVKAYSDFRAAKNAGKSLASNPVTNQLKTLQQTASDPATSSLPRTAPKPATTADLGTRTDPGAPPEGSSASVSTAGEATEDVGSSLETAAKGPAGTALKEGMEEGGELGKSLLGKVGEAAGSIGAVATGGFDVYQDIKAGGIAGNNNWEKAGNLLQIGGAVADVVGTVFPPAALLGGLLDLGSAAVDEVGAQLDDKKTTSDLDTTAATNQVSQVQGPIEATIATGRVQ